MNRRRLCWLVLLCAVSVASALSQTASQRDRQDRVATEMRNIMYHFTDRITAHIVRLQGAIVPTQEGGMPVFDDKRSFAVEVTTAEIAVSTAALTNVMNDYVFAAKDAPLKELSVVGAGDALKIKGKLHSKGDVPFETEGKLEATSDGLIRIHAEKIKAAHLPVKGLMDLVGVKIADLISTKKVAGVRSEGDDLLLEPEQIFPPPHIRGKLSRVAVRGDQIVLQYGPTPKQQPAGPVSGNYMEFHGGKMKFGKLVMTDTDMVLIDSDPRDPFDFFLDHYNDQLVAGYTKNTPQYGLRVFMVDYGKLGRKGSGRRSHVHNP
jgi:hypothetical protein